MNKDHVAKVLVDFNNTTVTVEQNGAICFKELVPTGYKHVIGDVSQCLRMRVQDSTDLCKSQGVCLAELVNEDETITIKNHKTGESAIVKKVLLTEVIDARVCEIFELIRNTLEKHTLLQDIVVFHIIQNDNYIKHMDDLLKKVMKVPVTTITSNEI